MSFEQNNLRMGQIINNKMHNKTHIWSLYKHLIRHAFLHLTLLAKTFQFSDNMSGGGEYVYQTLLNVFSFEIAIISASGKNVVIMLSY